MAAGLEHRIFDDESRQLDRFGFLLGLTAAAIVVWSLVDLRAPVGDVGGDVGSFVATLFVGATFLLALRASGVRHRRMIGAEIIVGLAVVASGLLVVLEVLSDEVVVETTTSRPTLSLVWVFMAVISPAAVIRRLVHHRRVTRATLLGAVAAYLLIALAFTFVFLTIDSFGDTRFFGTDEPTTSFMYYSLVTVTTLGYGDLTAATSVGQLASTTEAVVGQVFLVTFVAMMVGLFIQQRDAAPSDLVHGGDPSASDPVGPDPSSSDPVAGRSGVGPDGPGR